MRLMNGLFRLDFQRFLSYLNHMRVPALASSNKSTSKRISGYDPFLNRLSHHRKSVIGTAPGETVSARRVCALFRKCAPVLAPYFYMEPARIVLRSYICTIRHHWTRTLYQDAPGILKQTDKGPTEALASIAKMEPE